MIRKSKTDTRKYIDIKELNPTLRELNAEGKCWKKTAKWRDPSRKD